MVPDPDERLPVAKFYRDHTGDMPRYLGDDGRWAVVAVCRFPDSWCAPAPWGIVYVDAEHVDAFIARHGIDGDAPPVRHPQIVDVGEYFFPDPETAVRVCETMLAAAEAEVATLQ